MTLFYMQSADEILQIDQFQINNFCNSGDMKKAYFDFYNWKEIYQLTFNMSRNGKADENVVTVR